MFAGVEARGFIFGPPIALDIGAKFVPMRKPKKLPGKLLHVFMHLSFPVRKCSFLPVFFFFCFVLAKKFHLGPLQSNEIPHSEPLIQRNSTWCPFNPLQQGTDVSTFGSCGGLLFVTSTSH